MAPLQNSTSSTIQNGFDAAGFSSNTIGDLGPLLSLFGEQVTKQYTSAPPHPYNTLLLALGPIGIITIIVSAIRLSHGPGTALLKTLVGR